MPSFCPCLDALLYNGLQVSAPALRASSKLTRQTGALTAWMAARILSETAHKHIFQDFLVLIPAHTSLPCLNPKDLLEGRPLPYDFSHSWVQVFQLLEVRRASGKPAPCLSKTCIDGGKTD